MHSVFRTPFYYIPKISQVDEVPCQAEVRVLQKITLKFLWYRTLKSFEKIFLSGILTYSFKYQVPIPIRTPSRPLPKHRYIRKITPYIPVIGKYRTKSDTSFLNVKTSISFGVGQNDKPLDNRKFSADVSSRLDKLTTT